MGRWFREALRGSHDVAVHDVDPARSEVGMEELAQWADVIMVAAPITETRRALVRLSRVVGGRKTVFDIATFKGDIWDAYYAFPPEVSVATAHPMFGPGAPTIVGKRVVVMEVPGRCCVEPVEAFFRDMGATVLRGDVREHDAYVALTIGLPHVIGAAFRRLLRGLDPGKVELYAGTSFRWIHVYAMAMGGDWTLYCDRPDVADAARMFSGLLLSCEDPGPAPDRYYELFYKALESIGY